MPKSRKTKDRPAKMRSGKNATINTASISAKRTGLSQESNGSLGARSVRFGTPEPRFSNPNLAAIPRNHSIMRTSWQFHPERTFSAKQLDELLVTFLQVPFAGRLS